MSHAIPNARVPSLVFPTNTGASRYAAQLIAAVIRQNNTANKPTVLGLATGSTPVGTYRELIRLHREEGLDFARVVTFNLDEYHPMPGDDPHSYRRWMNETFFNHINIKPENVNIPSGDVPLDDAEKHCEEYEWKIKRAGGIDVQLLGIGRTGHIGFNEPGSPKSSRTRMVALDPVTRRDAASGFFGEENVPHRALTMGVGTILDARRIISVGLRRTQSAGRAALARAAADRRRHRLALAGPPRRPIFIGRARRLRTVGLPHALGTRHGQVDRRVGPQGRHLVVAQGRQGTC